MTAASRWASGSASLLHWKQHYNRAKGVYLLELYTCCMTVSSLFARAAYLVSDKERACCCFSGRARKVEQAMEGRVGARGCSSLLSNPHCTWFPYVPPHIQCCNSSIHAHKLQR